MLCGSINKSNLGPKVSHLSFTECVCYNKFVVFQQVSLLSLSFQFHFGNKLVKCSARISGGVIVASWSDLDV